MASAGVKHICKYCKHCNRIRMTCSRYRDKVTGEPFSCEICREDYPEFGDKNNLLCGRQGRYFEAREKWSLYKLNMGLGFLVSLFLVSNILCIAGLLVLNIESKSFLAVLYFVGQLGVLYVTGINCKKEVLSE